MVSDVVKLSDTFFVLSVFYHRSGIIFVALVAKPRVATSMRSHIPLQMTWYHTMSSRYFLYCSLRGAYKKQYLRWDGIYYHRSGKNCGKFTTWVYHITTTYSGLVLTTCELAKIQKSSHLLIQFADVAV